jgi:hypothetical protein
MMNTKIRQPPPQRRSPIIGLDNLLSRPGFANQTFDYMSTDRQYGFPNPKTGSFTLATLHGPGHVESCEELGPEWHYHSSKPENQPVYTYNSVGHRNDSDLKDLPDREFGIAFGCSQTEGIGLKHENVFHQIISKRLQIPFYNCGIAGAANDVTYWNFTQIMRRYKPAVVLYQLTASNRFLVNTNNKLTFAWGFPNPNFKPDQADDGFDFSVLANKLKYDTLRTQMQIESVKTVCKLTNTKLVFFDAFRQFLAPNSSRDEFPNGEELIFSIEEDFGWVDWSGMHTQDTHTSRAWAARDRWHMGIEDSNHIADRAMPFLNNGQPFANGA